MFDPSFRTLLRSAWPRWRAIKQVARKLLFGSIHYLRDSGLVIDGVKFWGSPWIPPYAGSFNLPENELQQK
jgi:hypothetical protein